MIDFKPQISFQHFSPTILIVGCGRIDSIGDLAGAYGRNALIVTSPSVLRYGVLARVMLSLKKNGIDSQEYMKPPGEPDIEMVDKALEVALEGGFDLIVSLGGGSVIDLCKAVCGVMTNGGSVIDYLESVGEGRPILRPAIPHIAVPTTAGTGAEVTRNAVISSKDGRFKKSMRSPYLYPQAAILDGELTIDLSPEQTAYSGMDAITQLIEAYISKKANPMTDALALFGMELAFEAIRDVYTNGHALEKRMHMLLASTMSGVCLANAGLGLAHGFASGLGGMYDIPHGKICAILLPHAMKINREAAELKLARIGRFFAKDGQTDESELADLAIDTIQTLTNDLSIPSDLKSCGIQRDELALAAKRSMGNSMSGNPVEIDEERAKSILEELLS